MDDDAVVFHDGHIDAVVADAAAGGYDAGILAGQFHQRAGLGVPEDILAQRGVDRVYGRHAEHFTYPLIRVDKTEIQILGQFSAKAGLAGPRHADDEYMNFQHALSPLVRIVRGRR